MPPCPPALDSHTLLVAAVIVHDVAAGRVLLLQRGRVEVRPAPLDLPSGKADKGESVTAAAARELKEETRLTVDPVTLRIAGIIHGA